MVDVDLFPCYSFNLRDFLETKGIRYKLIGLHPQTKRQFFVYVEDEDFKSAIIEWDKNKPK